MPDASSVKVCVHCGIDVSNSPRVRDPQGRYVCQGCVAKLQKQAAVAKAAPKPTGPGNPARGASSAAAKPPAADPEADVMNALINESLEQAKHGCPNCHGPMKANQIICIGCGFNRETGKALKTVEKAPVVIKEKKNRT